MSGLDQWAADTGGTTARMRGQARRAAQIEAKGGQAKWDEHTAKILGKLEKKTAKDAVKASKEHGH